MYPMPIASKQGEKELGLLLNFPECCVDSHFKGKDIGIRDRFNLVPFASCSEECDKPWLGEYLRLADKYGLDPTKRFISNNK
jgi:hypothetical protein